MTLVMHLFISNQLIWRKHRLAHVHKELGFIQKWIDSEMHLNQSQATET